jgi:crossover junction endodeoxyribonuclease RuvC
VFESRVALGVDPGVAATGIAAVRQEGNGHEVLWWATVRTPPALAEPSRLREVYRAIRAAIAEQRPGSLAVERVMWGRNVGSAMSVARATGVVLLAAAEAGLPVEEYAPLEVKMAVTGVGNASKVDVRRSLERALRVAPVPQEANAADAVAVAVCHLQQAGLRSAARRAGVEAVR